MNKKYVLVRVCAHTFRQGYVATCKHFLKLGGEYMEECNSIFSYFSYFWKNFMKQNQSVKKKAQFTNELK